MCVDVDVAAVVAQSFEAYASRTTQPDVCAILDFIHVFSYAHLRRCHLNLVVIVMGLSWVVSLVGTGQPLGKDRRDDRETDPDHVTWRPGGAHIGHSSSNTNSTRNAHVTWSKLLRFAP
jgi:hypothetical protein